MVSLNGICSITLLPIVFVDNAGDTNKDQVDILYVELRVEECKERIAGVQFFYFFLPYIKHLLF